MRPLLLFAFLSGVLNAAPALQIIKPIVSQMDGGAPEPAGFEHVGGETLYFSCRVAGYTRSEDEKVHLRYSVQAFDARDVPLDEIYKNDLTAEVSPQDKDWLPKIATEVAIPPLLGPGTFKIVVKVEDVQAKTTAELSVPFKVRGREVEPSDELVVRNFHFYRDEEGTHPMDKGVYKPGDGVWAKFDITGFKYGDRNKIDVSYVTSVIAASGKVLWTQPEAATEKSESFYPKRFVPAAMGISLQGNIKPGEYTIAVSAKDEVGGQSCDVKFTFVVE
jgi:hypothetical protein